MKYTVIHRSGWQGSSWNVYGTYPSKDEARSAIEAQPDHERNDPRGDFYNTAIKAHRKSLAQMMDRSHGGMVKFSDGVRAVW